MGIEYKDTIAAISHLIPKDIKITGDNILKELGTGSKPVVLRHLKRWRSEEEPLLTNSGLKNIDLPQSIVIAINNVITNKITDIESKYSERLASTEYELDSLISNYSELDEKYLQKKLALKKLEADINAEKIYSQKLSDDIDKERQLTRLAEDKIIHLQSKSDNHDKLEAKNKKMMEKLHSANKAIADAEKSAAVAIAKLESSTTLIETLTKTIAEKKEVIPK